MTIKQHAVQIVQTLQEHGYKAFLAGGCVRDMIMGKESFDYDIATDAMPHDVIRIFQKTIPVGIQFGVVIVVKEGHNFEVATFRAEDSYSDGRHPDAVTFSTAEQDAQRRDFTINGLFFDPIEERVIDYVGGQDDLRRGVVRAIGAPEARFDEDKLRMLRAVRFTATYHFRIDPATLAAVQRLAREIVIVSAERIADEMRKMLPHPRRAQAVELLRESNLLDVILPESRDFAVDEEAGRTAGDLTAWERTLRILDALQSPSFSITLAALVRHLGDRDAPHDALIETVGGRWRLSSDEIERAAWARRHESLVCQARRLPWPRLQRILIHRHSKELLTLAEAVAQVEDHATVEIAYCREKLALPTAQLNPPPLINGGDLIRAGLTPGPVFQVVLEAVRDAQLVGRLHTKEEALEHALVLSQR